MSDEQTGRVKESARLRGRLLLAIGAVGLGACCLGPALRPEYTYTPGAVLAAGTAPALPCLRPGDARLPGLLGLTANTGYVAAMAGPFTERDPAGATVCMYKGPSGSILDGASCGHGRPLEIERAARVAAVTARAGWG